MIINPIDYVTRTLRGSHTVLLREDPKYAQLIEFSYLHQALKQKKVCLYLTYLEKPLVEKQMNQKGLDTQQFRAKKQLHIFRISKEPFDFLKAVEQLQNNISNQFNFRHCTILWRFDKSKYQLKQMLAHIEQDSEVHSALYGKHIDGRKNGRLFHEFKGSILCSYPMDEMSLRHTRIIRHHLSNHQAVILAPKHGVGAVLQSNNGGKLDMERWIRNRLNI